MQIRNFPDPADAAGSGSDSDVSAGAADGGPDSGVSAGMAGSVSGSGDPAGADADRLLLRMQQGDTDAFRQLYESAARSVYAYTLSVIGNPQDAEEIMQDTFLSAWLHCGDYVSSGKPMAWLFTIARNRCYACLRRRTSHPDISLEALQEQDISWEPAGDDDLPGRSEGRQVLLAALGRLTPSERLVVCLHAMADMKHREIAKTLGQPVSTVISRYNRAIRKLRGELSEL